MSLILSLGVRIESNIGTIIIYDVRRNIGYQKRKSSESRIIISPAPPTYILDRVLQHVGGAEVTV